MKQVDARAPSVGTTMNTIGAQSLGDPQFMRDYGLRYAYLAGAMYKGIASRELVIALGRAGSIGYLGTGGLQLHEIAANIEHIQRELRRNQPYGMNLLRNFERPDLEEATVDLYLQRDIRFVEAAGFVQITPSVVRYRLTGIEADARGEARPRRRVLAKVSRPEVATAFMSPAPEPILQKLVASGALSETEARLGRRVPVAQEICGEADSGGHTDRGVAFTLMPAMFSLRDEIQRRFGYCEPIRVGAAGGIGTPHAAAAAFAMGADFVLTGSINQCTVEAGTSDRAKDLLQQLDVQDTAHAPAGDLFELGAKVQVVKRGLLFPGRANRLYELYQRHQALEELDDRTRQQLERTYFRRTFDEVWAETRAYYARTSPAKLAEAESSPRQKMALVFRWYFVHSSRLALQGSEEQSVDYQIQCGPAMGAFNRWVRGTDLEPWRNRHVAVIAERLMHATAELLQARFSAMSGQDASRVARRALD